MSTIKVVFVTASTRGGGAERVLVNIINSLSSDRYSITLINTGVDPKPEDLRLSVQYKQYNCGSAKSSFVRLVRDLKYVVPQHVFTTSIVLGYLLIFIRALFRFKFKVYVRIAVPPSELRLRSYKSNFLKIVNSYVLKHADMIVAQSDYSMIDISKQYRVPTSKIKVIQNIVDFRVLEMKGAAFFPNEFDPKCYNIVASGALYSVKGFDLLISAMEKIIFSYRNVKLFILGEERYETGYRKLLEQQIVESRLEDYVSLLGFKENPYPYYKHANLFVLSSRTEGFPNVVLEALYFGTPVVATNCVDFSDIISDGINGYVVEKESYISIFQGINDAITSLKKPCKTNIVNFDYQEIFV